MIALFILVANAVAVQCIGVVCKQVEYDLIKLLIQAGTLEMIFEVYGFVKIYVKKNKNNGDESKEE